MNDVNPADPAVEDTPDVPDAHDAPVAEDTAVVSTEGTASNTAFRDTADVCGNRTSWIRSATVPMCTKESGEAAV